MSKRTKKQKTKTRKAASTDLSSAVVAKYYKPVKKQVTLRLDADMLDWFKSQGGRYQSRINKVLRSYMESHR